MRTVILLGLLGCGSPGSIVDAPASSDAVPHDATIDAAPARDGLVTLSNDVAGGGANVSAVFVDGPAFGPTLGSDGPCKLFANPPSRGFSAGVISLTGTTTALTMTPNGTPPQVGYTTTPAVPATVFAPGATLTVQAAGGDVPAFTATVTAPSTLAGFTPPTTSLSRAAGYTATWTAGGGQGMWLIVIAEIGTGADVVLCRVPDTGSFAIPASTFALIPALATKAAVGLARVSEANVAIGQGSVAVVVASTASSKLLTLAP